jgi:beta-lactamase regulating signal transducer with metallopeptidase domain
MTMNTIEGLTIRWRPWTAEAILAHLWQSSLVGVAILVLMAAARRASARTRWAIGCIGLANFVLPLIWFNPTVARMEPAGLAGWPHFQDAWARIADRPFWVEVGAAVWLAGAAVLIVTWCLRGLLFRRRLLAESTSISESLRARVKTAAQRVGLAEIPRCIAACGHSGPGIMGVLSTLIVLPNSLERTLSGSEIDAILVHEMIHLKRRDPLLGGIQAVVVRLFWFNPLVWLIGKGLSMEMEKSCDEAVLETTADAEAYAGGIMKVVRQSLGLQQPGFAGAAGVSVIPRIRNILARSSEPRRRRPMTAAIGGALALVIFSGFSGAIRADAASGTPSGKALVVSNFTSLGRVPDFEAQLGDLGFSSATIRSADMANTDLSQYSLIVIPGTQLETGFYADYAKAAARFDRFVQNGGTLLLEVKGAEGEGILRQRFGAIPAQPEAFDTRAP